MLLPLGCARSSSCVLGGLEFASLGSLCREAPQQSASSESWAHRGGNAEAPKLSRVRQSWRFGAETRERRPFPKLRPNRNTTRSVFGRCRGAGGPKPVGRPGPERDEGLGWAGSLYLVYIYVIIIALIICIIIWYMCMYVCIYIYIYIYT